MRVLWARMATLGASWGPHESLLVILIKVSSLTSLLKLLGGFMGELMRPPGGPHEASWGVHGNLIGVSWGPHEGSWGRHDSSWGPYGGFMGTS